MNKEELEWLLDIATPTGISYSGDQTITIDFANKVINHINKQKEVIDKIKEYMKKNANEPVYLDMKLYEAEVYKDILELLEEIK
jgi:hypothetical protein